MPALTMEKIPVDGTREEMNLCASNIVVFTKGD
jgi:hypothetical protein